MTISPKHFELRAIPFMGLLLAVSILVGCGKDDTPPLGEVTGVVTLDGKPVEGANVRFLPGHTRGSSGGTDAKGRYELSFDDDHSGAAVGMHDVMISQRADVMKNPELGNQEQLPARYNEKTTLKREVKEGENVIDFKLTTEEPAESN